MFHVTTVLYEYTEILLGQRRNYSINFFHSGSSEEDEENAVKFIRTAVRAFLRCYSLEAAYATVTPALIKRMKLETAMNHIHVPQFVLPGKRTEYRIARVFQPGFNKEHWIAAQLCEGIIQKKVTKFPKFYMSDFEGYERAKQCLNYFVRHDMNMALIRICDLYMFSATPQFNTFLRDRLLQNVRIRFFDSPVEFLHESLSEDCQNDAYYHMYETIYFVNNRYVTRHFPEYDLSLISDGQKEGAISKEEEMVQEAFQNMDEMLLEGRLDEADERMLEEEED